MNAQLNHTTAVPRSSPASGLGSRPVSYLSVSPFICCCKRIFDLLIAIPAIFLTIPLFILIAIAIKIDSPGPVFFRQVRVGLRRRRFLMWKFRKMYDNLTQPGPGLTKRYDARLTRVGRFLERTKLDELPQLMNILLGHMSIVGPRPEVPRFVDEYAKQWDDVLSVKPGIFGPNQLRHRNESELYPPACQDLETFYTEHILPAKLRADATYARRLSFGRDFLLFVRCLGATLVGTITWQTLVTRRWQIANLLILSMLGLAGMLAATWLTSHSLSTDLAWYSLMLACLVKPCSLLAFKIPKALATSMTADDFLRIWWCAVSSASAIVTGMLLLDHRDVGRIIVLIDTTFFLAVLVMYKLLLYTLYLSFSLRESRYLSRRLLMASTLAAPVSLALVASFHYGFGVWATTQGRLHFYLMGLLTVIRPVVTLLMPVFPASSVTSWLVHEWKKLAVGAFLGSSFTVFAALFLNERALSRVDILCDAAVYCALVSALSLWQSSVIRRRWALPPQAKNGRPFGAPAQLLIVGEGIQLSAYITALAGFSKHRVVGVVTPDRRDRTSTVGGYAIMGETGEILEIIDIWGIDKVVVVKPILDAFTVQYVNELRRLGRVAVVEVDMSAGLEHGGRAFS